MKKIMMMVLIALAGLSASAQMTELTVALDMDVNRIEFSGLVWTPSNVSTNTAMVWQTAVVVYTNFYYGLQPDEVVTNTVQRQVPVTTIETNAARWNTGFAYTIPVGTPLTVAGGAMRASPSRPANLTVEMFMSEEQMIGLLGPELYAVTLQAAQLFGSVPVSGTLETMLRMAVLQAMSAGR